MVSSATSRLRVRVPPLNWWRGFAALALRCVMEVNAPAELIFQDFFTKPTGSVNSSMPWIDVFGGGWQAGSATTAPELDGSGHLFSSSTTEARFAGVRLIPIGPHGFMTVTATVKLPAGSAEWIGFGFGNTNQFLDGASSQTGPWLQVWGNGSVTLYGGAGASNAVTAAVFINSGSPVLVIFTYDAFNVAASVSVIAAGVTNKVFTLAPVKTTLSQIAAQYLIVQFPAGSTPPADRWMDDVSVDWFPRPRPMLTLPVAPVRVVNVGPPTGTNDTQLIQAALDTASNNSGALEIRFNNSATYVITSASLVTDNPLSLSRATNVLVNGNGCNIKITNPRIGFLHLSLCTNVIVQGFTVDYDPLPFTQGLVIRNFYTDPGSPPQSGLEVEIDAGYPLPTDPNYGDAEALAGAGRWVLAMDPTRPGRQADNRYALYAFRKITQTSNGVFRVEMVEPVHARTIQNGETVCLVSRWNGSAIYGLRQHCYQITFLNLTNYAGAAANFSGSFADMVNLVNCNVLIGPPPPGATRPRVKTTNADGGLFTDQRIGPWVEGCVFTGMSDDVGNANTLPLVARGSGRPPATNTFMLGGYNSGGAPSDIDSRFVQVGDDVSFLNPNNGVVFDRATVVGVNDQNVTFSHPVSGVVPGQTKTNTFLFNHTLNTSAVYLDNHFSNSRIHGIYCRANNMLIAHNVVAGMGKNAICADPALDLAAPNSFLPTNVVIIGNVLADCGYVYEAINNAIPDDDPAYALIQLHKTSINSDLVTTGHEISDIRILNNVFMDWRRTAITLRNVTAVDVIGNYFGAPLTNNGLAALTNHVVADLWASDYANVHFKGNVKVSTPLDNQAIRHDGAFVTIAGAFQQLTAPRLAVDRAGGSNVIVGWVSEAPGFVLQQTDSLETNTNWVDAAPLPFIAAASNSVMVPFPDGAAKRFYRARQR